MLYCLKCKKWAYRNHKCPILSLIPLKREMREVADKLYYLGFELLSAACFANPVQGSIYEHRIIMHVEFRYQYLVSILGDLPQGWKYYIETSSEDHWPISTLAYTERYVSLEFETIEQRVQQITAEFIRYLDTRDRTALGAIMMLSDN